MFLIVGHIPLIIVMIATAGANNTKNVMSNRLMNISSKNTRDIKDIIGNTSKEKAALALLFSIVAAI